MKIAELKGKSEQELKDMLPQLKKEQFNLRFQRAVGEAGGQARTKEVRRTIARVLTLINQKKG